MNLEDLTKIAMSKKCSVSIETGMQDACNGYGWHVKYSVSLIQHQRYCVRCKQLGRAHNSNHQWDARHKEIYIGLFINWGNAVEQTLKTIDLLPETGPYYIDKDSKKAYYNLI